MPLAGLVDVVAFDKTGTLTEPFACFHSVVPTAHANRMGTAIKQSCDLPVEFKVGICCICST